MPFHIHLEWAESARRGRFRTGVSLHSHTLHSRESLDFIYRAAVHVAPLAAAIRRGERRYQKLHGTPLDLSRGWWTPPLGPHDAWLVEKSQIEDLDLNAVVSLTDHDNMEAPALLQLLDECRDVPLSVEWTVPYRSTFFHLGVHNLPPLKARVLMEQMNQYRMAADEPQLRSILSEITAAPEALVIFNHPLWDEKGIGQAEHNAIAREFLLNFGASVHALELNGLRPWRENRSVIAFASDFQKPAISGGDRHAIEPNALVNLTNAGNFAEFAEEVRNGWSHVLVLKHYREPYSFRIIHNLMDVLKTYDRHAHGWRMWSDRVFYSCDDGQVRPLTALFGAKLPAAVALFVGAIQFVSTPHVRRFLRGAFPRTEEVRL